MMGRKGSPGLIVAGLGWGVAAGLALGVLVIAPAMPHGAVTADVSDADAEAETSTSENMDPQESAVDRDEAAAANDLIASKSDEMVAGALEGQRVVILRTAGVSDDDLNKQRWLLNKAGSEDAGTITLTEKFTSQDSANELSSIIATTLPAGAQLSVDDRAPGVHAGEALSAALLSDEFGTARASDDDRDFLLNALADAGFIDVGDSALQTADAVIVMRDADSSGFGGQLINDLAGAIKDSGSAVVVGTNGYQEVGASTAREVDFADTEAGRVGIVLALGEEVG